MDELNGLSLTETETDDAIARLEAMQDMIGSMGWRWFIAEIEKEREVIKEQLLISDADSFRFLQGRADQLAQVLAFEDLVDNYLDALTSEKGE